MTSLTIPIILAGLGLVAGVLAYRGIRRGAARFYALERDAMLRRASYTLIASLLLFAGCVGLLMFNVNQLTTSIDEAAAATAEAPVLVEATAPVIDTLPPRATEAPIILSQPPTLAAEPTIDLTLPTAEPTPIIRRGIIEGTAGSGANLREGPSVNAAELAVLDDGTVVTLVDGAIPVEANNFTWVNIRTGAGIDGWVVDLYLTISSGP